MNRLITLVVGLLLIGPQASFASCNETLCSKNTSPVMVNGSRYLALGWGGNESKFADLMTVCMAMDLADLQKCEEKCKEGCCSTPDVRKCTLMIVRGASEGVAQIPFASSGMNYEAAGPIQFPCKPIVTKETASGMLKFSSVIEHAQIPYSCPQAESYKQKSCSELKALWNKERDDWIKLIAEKAKVTEGMKQWDKDANRCGKGHGLFKNHTLDLICDANDKVVQLPKLTVSAECLQRMGGGFEASMTAALVKECRSCAVETGSEQHKTQ